jgi:hypothetical protein
MCIVAAPHGIASAYSVSFGHYGDVTRYAQQRGVCRQRIYREATWVSAALAAAPAAQQALAQQLSQLRHQLAQAQAQLARAVVLDRDKQAEFATVGQAIGVSLPALRTLLAVVLPGRVPSVATLGRRTQAAGRRAGPLLAVLDEQTRPHVRQALADEIYLPQPVLMVVEPVSLCWVSGVLTPTVTGAAWTEELARLPHLEQVTRDGGSCLRKGAADLQRQRDAAAPLAVQWDHFHLLREGARVVGRAERAAQRAVQARVTAQAAYDRAVRNGQALTVPSNRLRARLAQEQRALDVWVQYAQAWEQTKAAVQPFTPQGELNTRAQATAALAESLARLPDPAFAAVKRLLRQPEVLAYLDEVERRLAALPVPAEVRQAAVRQEGLRRRPELLRGTGVSAAALRGVLLVTAVVLTKAGAAGEQALPAVRAILRSSGRASSLVECVNSTLRMQQSRHRRMSQGLVDLKRLYWNCHRFRSGRRRKHSPYELLGVRWPEGMSWWELLKRSPEQLRAELSALNQAG